MEEGKKRSVIYIAAAIIAVIVIAGFIITVSNPASAQEITREDAEEIALKHAELKKDDVENLVTSEDMDDDVLTYDVEFIYENMEYDYTIDGRNGDVLEVSKEKSDFKTQEDKDYPVMDENNSKNYIGEDKAKSIAAEDAAVKDANFIKVVLDSDKGVAYYDVEFTSAGYEYNYEIGAVTGNILEQDKEELPKK